MRLKQLIGTLGALGLFWMAQFILFAGIFSLMLFLFTQIFDVATVGPVPVLAVSGGLAFLFLAGLQTLARRRGWIRRSATVPRDP